VNSSIESFNDNEEALAPVPKNYYFIESQISPLILDWQKFYRKQKDIEEYLKNEKSNDEDVGFYELTLKQKKDLQDDLQANIKLAKPLLETIMTETYKIIKGVIFRAEFHKREKYNICFQIAVEACIKALPRFDPEQGTAFNYLSLTAKKSIIYYLIKRAKKKHLSLDYEYLDDDNLKLENILKQDEKSIRNLEIENLSDSIFNLIEEKSEFRGLAGVNKELRNFLFYTRGKYEKKEFFKWCRSQGYSSNLLRKFIKFLKENKGELYKEVGVY
jgi:hypothetical protein